MGDIQQTNGFYVGRELKGEGKTKAGKDWMRFKVLFKPSIQSEKTFSATAFHPLAAKNTLQLKDLEENSYYKIGFVENEFTTQDGQQAKSKTMIYINKSDPNKKEEQTTIASLQGVKLDLSKFDEFKEKYSSAVLKNNDLVAVEGSEKELIYANPLHMLGSFIVTYEKDRYNELFEKCNVSFKK